MNHDTCRCTRIVGVEDGGFVRDFSGKTLLVAVLAEETSIIDCAVDEITVDGLDATEKLVQMLQKWSFDIIMLAGVSFGGFNLIDPATLCEQFRKPVIVIARIRPDNVAVKAALQKHFNDWKKRWSIFEGLGPVHEMRVKPFEPAIFVEAVGIGYEQAYKILRRSVLVSRVPEPLRAARLIARGLTKKSPA